MFLQPDNHVPITWEEAQRQMNGRRIVITQSSVGFQTTGTIGEVWVESDILKIPILKPQRRRHPSSEAFIPAPDCALYWTGMGRTVFRTQAGFLYLPLPFVDHAIVGG